MDFHGFTRDSRLLAAKMLNCWLSGDHYRLSRELDEMLYLPLQAEGGHEGDDEGDRVEVLRSMAHRMKADGELFAPRNSNARVGLWIDLLDHFSRPR
jgi:hypothetical protein